MQKLGELSILGESVIRRLAQNRIVTILDFLEENIEKLSAITKLTLPDVLSVRNEIFLKYSSPVINGSSLLIQSLVNRNVIRTNIDSLDAVLNDGIPIGFITEICGLADSGKTQLCFQIAINCVKKTNSSVLYIDTKGDFSAIRVQKILEANRLSHKDMALIMYKIRVICLWTMEEVVEFLKHLMNKTLVIDNLALIILDSLPSLMFQYIGDEVKIGLSNLNIFVNNARFLCKELHLAMICVNVLTRWVEQGNADSDDDEEYSMFKDTNNVTEKINRCLGKYWQLIPAVVLLLEKNTFNEESDTNVNVSVSLIRSNKLESKNRQCVINISALGVT